MERRKLTKADIDKVRNIEGFPIGSDEDIIALSDAPFYTACPNPFIEEFIKENGTPYDEAKDGYHREPFAADVSEGKSDPIYNAHMYHTKVPYKAIMRYILHYTNPGDIVFDGFCGSGMTGVAAQMCGTTDPQTRLEMESGDPNIKWGNRFAILNDLSPAASFIAHNINTPIDVAEYNSEMENIISQTSKECGWMYETRHVPVTHGQQSLISDKKAKGVINSIVWSEVLICPHCGSENVFWDMACANETDKKVQTVYHCSNCHSEIIKRSCARAVEVVYDNLIDKPVQLVKFVPVSISYDYNGSRYEKAPDAEDLALIERINSMMPPVWVPNNLIRVGDKTDDPERLGILYVHQMFTRRNLIALGCAMKYAKSAHAKFTITAAMFRVSKMNKYSWSLKSGNGTLSGTLCITSLHVEKNVIETIARKFNDINKAIYPAQNTTLTQCGSLADIKNIPSNSIDYIFTDPPFGDNLNYSELNFMWESWLKVITTIETEAIVSPKQNKRLAEYQTLLEACLSEYYRIIKPNRWITIEFHNSKNAVWNAISEAIQKAGFIIADVHTLNKKQGSYNQVRGAEQAIKQDLVISAYKPKDSFNRKMIEKAGSEDTAWEFVRQHLSNIPVVIDENNNGKLDIIAERQAFLLYDRMLSYHIMQGYYIPLDATDFYRGLDERFLKRDTMYFLPDQVNEYDVARATRDVESIQFTLFVSDEKSAIGWLYQQLDSNSGEGPQSYSELTPKFMQELKAVDKREKMPELLEILEENFLKDDTGKWYIPDLNKSGDIAKLREKNLLKEFQEYLSTKGKLKRFRSEAIRAGFAKLWKDKDYATIVSVAERLPEETIHEDQNLLMYYDISLGRV